MSLRQLGGVQHMKAWEEAIEKEETTRLNWHDKQKVKNIEGQTEAKSKQYEVFRKKIELGGPAITEDFLKRLPPVKRTQGFHKKIPKYDDKLLKEFGEAGKENELMEMKPPSMNMRKMLFDGFTKEEKGRYQYLDRRHRIIPEKKYVFPLVSSWEYGWRLGDVIKKEEIKKPTYARNKIIRDTFYTRNGVPDLAQPAFYKSYTSLF